VLRDKAEVAGHFITSDRRVSNSAANVPLVAHALGIRCQSHNGEEWTSPTPLRLTQAHQPVVDARSAVVTSAAKLPLREITVFPRIKASILVLRKQSSALRFADNGFILVERCVEQYRYAVRARKLSIKR